MTSQGALGLLRLGEPIFFPQRLRLLRTAKRIERVGSDAGAVLSPCVVPARPRLLISRKRGLRDGQSRAIMIGAYGIDLKSNFPVWMNNLAPPRRGSSIKYNTQATVYQSTSLPVYRRGSVSSLRLEAVMSGEVNERAVVDDAADGLADDRRLHAVIQNLAGERRQSRRTPPCDSAEPPACPDEVRSGPKSAG